MWVLLALSTIGPKIPTDYVHLNGEMCPLCSNFSEDSYLNLRYDWSFGEVVTLVHTI